MLAVYSRTDGLTPVSRNVTESKTGFIFTSFLIKVFKFTDVGRLTTGCIARWLPAVQVRGHTNCRCNITVASGSSDTRWCLHAADRVGFHNSEPPRGQTGGLHHDFGSQFEWEMLLLSQLLNMKRCYCQHSWKIILSSMFGLQAEFTSVRLLSRQQTPSIGRFSDQLNLGCSSWTQTFEKDRLDTSTKHSDFLCHTEPISITFDEFFENFFVTLLLTKN